MSTVGKVIKCQAAVAWEPEKPFSIEEIEVDPPKTDEVRIKVVATGVCHSDAFSLSGKDIGPRCRFPTILGHESSGIVESIGEGVISLKPGDHVVTLFMPQCRNCKLCLNKKTNHCEQQRQGQILMLDGTSRFRCKGEVLYHFMECSTFTEYTVMREIALSKVPKEAPLEKICLLACGIPTGYGAAMNVAKVEPGSTCAIFGLGGVGLAAVLGCKVAGAKRIIGIDINPNKEDVAKQFGITEFVNPKDFNKPIQEVLIDMTNGGLDYSFECTGNVIAMRSAIESCHRGYGMCVIIGISDGEITTSSSTLVMGRVWTGARFGGYKSRDSVPRLVDDYLNKKINLDDFITEIVSLRDINKAFDTMLAGKCIRTVIKF